LFQEHLTQLQLVALALEESIHQDFLAELEQHRLSELYGASLAELAEATMGLQRELAQDLAVAVDPINQPHQMVRESQELLAVVAEVRDLLMVDNRQPLMVEEQARMDLTQEQLD
jgi:hypothetical protein